MGTDFSVEDSLLVAAIVWRQIKNATSLENIDILLLFGLCICVVYHGGLRPLNVCAKPEPKS